MTGVDDLGLSENSVEEEIGDPGYDIPYTTGPSEPATVHRVMIKESPHLNMFHGHVPIQVTLDSGATENLISSHAAKYTFSPPLRAPTKLTAIPHWKLSGKPT